MDAPIHFMMARYHYFPTCFPFSDSIYDGDRIHSNQSVSALDLILIHSRDGLEVSSPARSRSLPILGLQRPSVLSQPGRGVATGRTGALLLMVGHAAATTAESVGLGVALTEGRSAPAHCSVWLLLYRNIKIIH